MITFSQTANAGNVITTLDFEVVAIADSGLDDPTAVLNDLYEQWKHCNIRGQ